MNGLSNLDETFSEYSQAHIEDLIRFWRSKVSVTAGHRGGECSNVDSIGSPSNSSSNVLYVISLYTRCMFTFIIDNFSSPGRAIAWLCVSVSQ